jgi:RNA-binding protein FUS
MAYNPDTMSFDVPNTDTVYVTGLPPNITEDDVAEYFGSIGVIKIDKKTRGKKIWLYRDKATGQLKGDGTVSYDDPFSAGSAVQWFHDKEWKGGCCLIPAAHSIAAYNSADFMPVGVQHC